MQCISESTRLSDRNNTKSSPMNIKDKNNLRIRRTVDKSPLLANSTSEPSPESDSTSEPSPESDSTSEPSPESHSTSEPSPESDSTSEPSPESDSTSEPSPESHSTSEPSPESDSTSQPSPESHSTSEPSPESHSTSEPSPESDSISEPSPESHSTSEPSPESHSTSEPSLESDSISEPSPESDSTSEPSPKSDSTSEPSPESHSTSEPSPESDSTSEPSPESHSTSEPSPESDSTSEPSAESHSTSEPSPESDSISEPSPESHSTSEPSPESHSTSEPSPESDSISEPSPESDSTSEPSPKSDSTSEPSPESHSTSEPSPESDSTSEPSPESHSTSEPSPESDSTSEPSAESHSTSEPSPESDSISEPSPESDSTSEPSPKSDSTSEPSPESDSTSEPSPESDSTSEPSPESDSTSEPSPESDSTSEPSPESDSTSEPSPESDSTSEPSPESESTSEPNSGNSNYGESSPEEHARSEHGQAESEPEPQPETWPEPAPEWEKAYKLWRNAWPAHTYLFAIIFLLMAFYSGYYIIVNVKDGLGKKYLSISLNVMMCTLSITRSFVLFFDPYHQGTLIKNKLSLQLMWSIGTPCLLASDSLCILALAESASVNVTHQRFQRFPNILIVVFLHFILVIATDIVVSAHSSAKVMILYCQVFSTIWGSLLGFWYFTLAHKINQVLFKAAGRRKTRGDRIYLLLVYLSSAANLFTCALILYSAVGVFGIYSEVKFVEAWPWYSLQTGMRISEVVAAVLVFTVSAKRNRIKNKVHNVIVCGEPSSQVTNKSNDIDLNTIPTVTNLYPAARNRRMSMFSAVHQSKISVQDNTGNDKTQESLSSQSINMVASGKTRQSRTRRLSLFSDLYESKLSASTVSTTQPTQLRNTFSAEAQSKPAENEKRDLNERSMNDSENTARKDRRMSMFSQLQQIKLSANANNSIPHSLKPKPTLSTKSKDDKKSIPTGGGRRMSMFSQLQELKISANGNNSIPSSFERKMTPLSVHEVKNKCQAPNKGRRMSMFSQLQELKMSTNNSLPSTLESENSNVNEEDWKISSGILSRLHHFVAFRKKNTSDESKENTEHPNFLSKLFQTKVTPVTSSSPKIGRKFNKMTTLCRTVETADVHVNNTNFARENMIGEDVNHTLDVHGDVTEIPKANENTKDIHVNSMPSSREGVINSEWRRSRPSLFASLREAKLDKMKIIEDDEEEVEEQCSLTSYRQASEVFNRRKSSSRNLICAIDIDKNEEMCKDVAIAMQDINKGSTFKENSQLPDADV